MNRLSPLVLCLAVLARAAFAVEPLRVDLNPDNDRKDVLSGHAENWRFVDGPAVSRSIGDVTVTFRKAGPAGTSLTTGWWKAGYDTGATLASDGVTVQNGDQGGQIEMVVGGLSPGGHTIVTYHNSWASGISPFSVAVDGRTVLHGLRPSLHVGSDYDCATAFLEIEALSGKDVVLAFRPDGTGKVDNIVLSGFAIDVADPARQASKPSPADRDEHATEEPVLSWRPAVGAIAHHVYFGRSYESVAKATPSSPEFQGATTDARFAMRGLNPYDTYYWRVDEVQTDPTHAIKGDIWRFRVRRLAFPGAEGYGRFARGGSGGRVIEVTNLDDSGPGALRAAVDAVGPRIVVFRVGGTIRLKSKLVIRNPYITIAGQTAPGDGICVRGYTFGCLGTHDVVIRHVRIRVGDEAGVTMDGTGFASTDHAIMDHCSVSWSIDEGVSSRSAGNITVQRCIVAEALNIAGHEKYEAGKGHSFAGSISGNIGSFHHNLLAHCAGRNWSLAGGLTRGGKFAGYLDLRNNVVYNWRHRTTDGGVKALNFVNNYYLPGPATQVFHLLKPDAGKPDDPQQYYLAGNVMVGRPQYDADNWAGAVVDPKLLSQIRLEEPFCESHVVTQTAEEAYASVMADVGANWPRLDAVDRRILNDVLTRQATVTGSRGKLPGIIDSQADVGGWPELAGGEAPPDADHDGMPDTWETAHGSDPRNPADSSQIGASGYTRLEEYLNQIAIAPCLEVLESNRRGTRYHLAAERHLPVARPFKALKGRATGRRRSAAGHFNQIAAALPSRPSELPELARAVISRRSGSSGQAIHRFSRSWRFFRPSR